MNERMNEWKDEWMNEWLNEHINKWINVLIKWTNEKINIRKIISKLINIKIWLNKQNQWIKINAIKEMIYTCTNK